MTDLRKAAEMALKWMEATHHTAMTTYSDEAYKEHCNVERKLRQALAQPEQTKCLRCGEVNPAEIHTCSPQVAQEPVAWLTPDGEGFRMRLKPPVNDVPLGWKALYTAPPSKEWVGLHWADMPETYAGDKSFLHGAVWAEAKLKEKNT